MLKLKGWLLVPALLISATFSLLPGGDPANIATSLRGVFEFALLSLGSLGAFIFLFTQRHLTTEFFYLITRPIFVSLLLFAVWAMLSLLWSPTPILSFIKGFELVLILVVAVASSLIINNYGIKIEGVLVYTILPLIVIMLGINISTVGTPLKISDMTIAERSRFMLAYDHPLASADILALAILVMFALTTNLPIKTVIISLLVVGLILTDGRAPIVGLSIALFSMKFANWSFAYKLMGFFFIGSLIFIFLFWDSYHDFVGINSIYTMLLEENRDLTTLNNRFGVWSVAIMIFRDHFFTGVGYYSTRFFLLDYYSWAGQAHNAFIEVAMATGIFGLSFFLSFLLFTLKLALRNRLLLGVLVYTLTRSIFAPVLFSPSFPMVIITILIAVALLRQHKSHFAKNINFQDSKEAFLRYSKSI